MISLTRETRNQGHPYGVYQAVLDAFADDDRMQFSGLFGSTALFRMID
jgi:hypothetical protein